MTSEPKPGAAIIGMAAAMPKARDLGQFWGRLLRGIECFDTVPEDRWDKTLFFDADPKADE